jgi:protein CpxP
MRRHLLACAVPTLWFAALLLPAGALAQATPHSPAASEAAAPSGTAAPGETAAPRQEAERTMMQRVDRRIAELHAKLHITPAEEPEWRRFADVMRDNIRQMARALAKREQEFRSMSAVEDMRSYAGIAALHAKNMERLVPAFQNLYNSLSVKQKHAADLLWHNYAEQASQRHRR